MRLARRTSDWRSSGSCSRSGIDAPSSRTGTTGMPRARPLRTSMRTKSLGLSSRRRRVLGSAALAQSGPISTSMTSSLSRSRPAIAPSSAAFPSAATSTCAPCLCRPPTSSLSEGRPRRSALSGRGSSRPPGASPIATCWRLRSPTSSPVSPGPFSHAATPTSQGPPPMPLNVGSLWFTKEMDAPPLRHPRSPISLDWASERRWLLGRCDR
jgi:hypothetical protein